MPRYKKPNPEPKPLGNPALVAGGAGSYPPTTKGKKRTGPLDWSLDELIAYRENGRPPMRIPDPDILYKLGTIGVSMKNACDLFGVSMDKFCSNLDWLENWQRGRAECGAQIRASIVEDALEKDNLMAKIYIDKMIGGDKESPTALIQVNVNSELGQVSTDDLLNVVFEEKDGNEDTQGQ